MGVREIEKENEDLGTLADFIAHPELYSYYVDEDLDWVITRRKSVEDSYYE